MRFLWLPLWIRGAVVALVLVSGGCFGEITLPTCKVVEECPRCGNWNACEDGFCFHFGDSEWDDEPCCLEATQPSTDSDRCCPGRAAEAQLDVDCQGGVVDLAADGAEHLGPPVRSGDSIFVIQRLSDRRDLVRVTGGIVASRLEFDVAADLPTALDVLGVMGDDLVVAQPTGACVAGGACVSLGLPAHAPVGLSDRRYALALAGDGAVHVVADGGSVAFAPGGVAVISVAGDAEDLFVAREGGAVASYRHSGMGGELSPRWETPNAGAAFHLTPVDGQRLVFRTVDGLRLLFSQSGEPGPAVSVGVTTAPAVGADWIAAASAAGGLAVFSHDLTPRNVVQSVDGLGVSVRPVAGEGGKLYAAGAGHVVGAERSGGDWQVQWAFSGLRSTITGVTSGADGSLWATETPDRLTRITPGYQTAITPGDEGT